MRQGLLFSIIVSIIFCAPVLAYDWSTNPGDGSAANPYQISTPEQLMSIGSNVDLLDKHFILINDIVFDPDNNSEHMFGRALIAPDIDDDSNFFQGPVFSGVFDGNNHIVSNLIINGGYACGLFGMINSNGAITDLGLENVSVSGSWTGGLCGWISGSGEGAGGTITNCYVTGSINGTGPVGGLCGYSYRGDIADCYVTGTVSGTGFSAGGLCGAAVDTNFTNCHVNVTVSQEYEAGGLLGFYNGGLVSGCSATGNVAAFSSVGGLVGRTFSGGSGAPPAFDVLETPTIMTEGAVDLISSCYSNCNLSGVRSIGGLIGTNRRRDILNCYSEGTITVGLETTNVGGLIGSNSGTIGACYSSTQIFGVEGVNYVGGLIGYSSESQTVTSSYFLASAGPDNGFGTPLTDGQMKQQVSFVGWDFENMWKIKEGNHYPRLWWEVTNTLPVADAGTDQTVFAFVDGYALVQLDGTDSYDEDGDELIFSWYDANELIATGAEPNIVFGLGQYEVTLIVNDGIEDSQPDSCVITVVDPFEALTGAVTELVQDAGVANSLLAKVDAALKILEDGNANNDGAAAGSLGGFINAVNAQRGKKISEADADSLIAAAQRIIDML